MDIPPEVKESLPGIGGSLTAILFFRKPWPMLIALFVCGFTAAIFLGPTVASYIGARGEVAGYITGLFSMAIVAKVFDTISAFDSKKVADSILNRIRG